MDWKDRRISVKLPHNYVVRAIEREMRDSRIDIGRKVIHNRYGDWKGVDYCTYVGARAAGGWTHTCELYFHVCGFPRTNRITSHHCGHYPETQRAILDFLKLKESEL